MGAILAGATLAGATLAGATLAGATLVGATLTRSNPGGGNPAGATLAPCRGQPCNPGGGNVRYKRMCIYIYIYIYIHICLESQRSWRGPLMEKFGRARSLNRRGQFRRPTQVGWRQPCHMYIGLESPFIDKND